MFYKHNNGFVRLNTKFVDGWKLKPDYNPLNLPLNTVRVRTSDGNVPYKATGGARYKTATLVEGTSDVYDVVPYDGGTIFYRFLYYSTNVTEVLGANTSGVTYMNGMFYGCSALTNVALFDTSNVTYMGSMFQDCTSLTRVPWFDTSNVTNMNVMFANCINVQSGALALYQQASTQTNPPSSHIGTFRNCGSNTVNGAAELAQIPSNWK